MKPMLVRSTMHLPGPLHLPGGLQPGGVYWVDADSEYVRECLAATVLVPVPLPEAPTEDE